ncbi:hypothetical protein [Streptomyces sp. NBC_01235]|uniref:hypothetical protein n=1 Tax=Streptomyces sp. NBC_01235 TaxID=2903788 RepID=UPI002E129383|nr:hypothetical protein OG289_28530 [Streptomyces sp. NBC_01235]
MRVSLAADLAGEALTGDLTLSAIRRVRLRNRQDGLGEGPQQPLAAAARHRPISAATASTYEATPSTSGWRML